MEKILIEENDLKDKFGFFVPILVENDAAWGKLKDRYPEMLADLTSARFNPSCSCRNRVASFLNEKYISSDEDKKFINHLFEIPDISEKTINIIKEHKSQELMHENFPKIHTIPKGEASWRNFIDLLRKNNFQLTSFSVLEKDENNVTVYLI